MESDQHPCAGFKRVFILGCKMSVEVADDDVYGETYDGRRDRYLGV